MGCPQAEGNSIMRKEVIFAIILGLILGGVILYGIQLSNTSAQNAASNTAEVTPTPTQTVTPDTKNLTVISPQDHSVVSTGTIKIVGRTIPNSSVAIQGSEDDIIVKADDTGNFTADFSVTGGENIIQVTSLSPDQKTETLTLTVIYTTAKIE